MGSLNSKAYFYSKLEDELSEQLSSRQKAFVDEFLIDHDAKLAALRSGYRPEQGEMLLTQPKIINAIQAVYAFRINRTKIQQEQVLYETALIAFSSLQHFSIDNQGNIGLVDGAPANAMRAVQSIHKRVTTTTDVEGNTKTVFDVDIKLWDKPNALKLLGKQIGLFPDKVEVTGKNGGPIETVTKIERVIVDPKTPDITSLPTVKESTGDPNQLVGYTKGEVQH